LRPIKRFSGAEWNDRDIEAGAEWETEIDRHLSSADIILLLISASFLASQYCWGVEVKKALERHARGEARVILVILRPCRWQSTPFARLQATPKDAKPATAWPDLDTAFDDVVSKIEAVVLELQRKHASVVDPPKPPQPKSQEPWSATGQDRHGVWAEIDVPPATGKPVRQRMRWIAPGRFRMGSPEGEAGRYDNEGPQHEVQVSRGFWLFDTPCTQALWEAVMGDNPSRFQSPERPVEQVSWEEVQEFLRRIEERVPGLALPTEAQWEYACRAGTQTATYAGDLEILGDSNAPLLDAIAWYSGNSGVGFELDNGWDSSDWPGKQYRGQRAGC
jgi:formylglycine-generating enzyme required for sulfatase activity